VDLLQKQVVICLLFDSYGNVSHLALFDMLSVPPLEAIKAAGNGDQELRLSTAGTAQHAKPLSLFSISRHTMHDVSTPEGEVQAADDIRWALRRSAQKYTEQSLADGANPEITASNKPIEELAEYARNMGYFSLSFVQAAAYCQWDAAIIDGGPKGPCRRVDKWGMDMVSYPPRASAFGQFKSALMVVPKGQTKAEATIHIRYYKASLIDFLCIVLVLEGINVFYVLPLRAVVGNTIRAVHYTVDGRPLMGPIPKEGESSVHRSTKAKAFSAEFSHLARPMSDPKMMALCFAEMLSAGSIGVEGTTVLPPPPAHDAAEAEG